MLLSAELFVNICHLHTSVFAGAYICVLITFDKEVHVIPAVSVSMFKMCEKVTNFAEE